MPFTVNVGPYQGGNFLAAGLGSLGKSIGEGVTSAVAERKQQQQDQAQADTIFEEWLKSNDFTGEAMATGDLTDPAALKDKAKQLAAAKAKDYYNLGPSARKGVAIGIVQNWLQRSRASEAAYRAEQAKAIPSEIAYRTAEANRITEGLAHAFQDITLPGREVPLPPGAIGPPSMEPGAVIGRTGPTGAAEYIPEHLQNPYDLAAPTVTRPRDEQGKPLPFVIVRYGRTMSIQRDVPDQPITLDQETGQWVDTKGKPLPPALQDSINEFRRGPAPPAEPTTGEKIKNFLLMRPPLGTTPTPTPAPSGKPSTAAPSAKPTRAEAIAYIQSIGLKPTEANIQHYIDNAPKPK